MLSMRNFKPGLLPTLIAVPGIVMMIGFGIWQLERLAWKNGLLARIEARMAAPAVTPDSLSGDPAQDEYRHVRLRGKIVVERELFQVARSLNGNVGSHVLSAFALDNGKTVLIDRGWVPDERKEPARRAAGQLKDTVELIGVVRLSQQSGWFTPNNDAARNVWFYIDVPAMQKTLGIAADSAYWYAIEAPANPGGFPIGAQTRVNIPNDHLQYAITWFAFALSLGAIYLLYGRRRAREPAGARPT